MKEMKTMTNEKEIISENEELKVIEGQECEP